MEHTYKPNALQFKMSDSSSDEENQIEKINFNCPWTITTPSGATEDFIITQLRWCFNAPFWLEATIHPKADPNKIHILNIKRKTFIFAQLAIALAIYEKNPEAHLSYIKLHELGELTDTFEFMMGPYEEYFLQQIQEKVLNNQN